MVAVPYRGTAPAITDLIAGQVQLTITGATAVLQHVQSGSLRGLGVTTLERIAVAPDIAAIAETLPGFLSAAWYAFVAPPKTPKAIVEKISADVNRALKDPEIQDKLKKLSAEVMGGTPQQAAEFMQQERERWGNVIKTAHITLQ